MGLGDVVAERLASVRALVGPSVTIVAVTKGFGPEAVAAARQAGLADVGENYAQELLAKHDPALHWHFLGHVQRNKIKKLSPLVSLWQSIDTVELGRAIHGPKLVQVNLSGLPQRNGCTPEDAPALIEALDDVEGVMGVAGPGEPRPQFRLLRRLADDHGLAVVSMGMSGDYAEAVDEGSTMLRLGTALFGPRPERADLRR